MMIGKKYILVSFILILMCFQWNIYSKEPRSIEEIAEKEWGIGIGPMFGYYEATKVLGLDVSYTGFGTVMKTLHIPLYMTLSLTPRVHFAESKDTFVSLDALVSWYLFLNFGAGVTVLDITKGDIGYHLFLGLPLGIDYKVKGIYPIEWIYIEPYYRYGFHGVHEFGFLLKINNFRIFFH